MTALVGSKGVAGLLLSNNADVNAKGTIFVNKMPQLFHPHLGNYDFWRVALDKREGSVKDKLVLCRAEAPLFSPERLRTKALEISR